MIKVYRYKVGYDRSQKRSYECRQAKQESKRNISCLVQETRDKIINGNLIIENNKQEVAKLNTQGASYGDGSVLKNKYPQDIYTNPKCYFQRDFITAPCLHHFISDFKIKNN